MQLERILTEAVHGRPAGPTWEVYGTNPRGESFTIGGYRRRFDAADFAAECNGKGGSVKVRKVNPADVLKAR